MLLVGVMEPDNAGGAGTVKLVSIILVYHHWLQPLVYKYVLLLRWSTQSDTITAPTVLNWAFILICCKYSLLLFSFHLVYGWPEQQSGWACEL